MNLWHSERLFPLAPAFDFFAGFRHPFDFIFLGLLLILLLLNCFVKKKLVNHLVLGLVFLLALQDQNRWQPWVYLYFLCLVPFSFARKDDGSKHTSLQYFQLLLAGIYFWSGIHKCSTNFLDLTFEPMLTGLFRIADPKIIKALKPWGYSIPALEIITSMALLIPRTRTIGVFLALATHLFILVYLSPLGIDGNYIVYPWNIAMIGLVILSFLQVKGSSFTWQGTSLKSKLLSLLILLLAWFMPVFNFFGYWDSYLAFSLYSEKINEYYIIVAEDELLKIDQRLSAYFLQSKDLQGGQIIDVNKWSLEELNVPFYPETRVFKKVCESFCGLNIEEGKLFFLEFEKPLEKGKFYRFTCKDLP
ncbi:MauE/DoxX family redox-associated membrane protein [Adhaeribacter soli]|uniref:Methylamine utilisation protein MauE domain-containing protein n=1 Tax=Adhaeribacter soli TaxID=2607655 RepID=A0A5N1J6H0_9BACT|nr:MauE/DoxX family redox-associated membrane protein [Adhaeribacter soli]KAA9340203.1 hypothetical protein F0P94_07600 [Adhaeribacter soli]